PETTLKYFLVEQAYFALQEFLRKQVLNRLGASGWNDITFLEALEFIKEGLEKNHLKKLKKFKEESGFKTFFCAVVARLYLDFWRDKKKVKDQVTKYGNDFDNLFTPQWQGPIERLLGSDDEKRREKAGRYLPGVLEKLEPGERLVVQLKYEYNLKLSEIARTLDETRYKTEQFINQTEIKIKNKLEEFL
ncbi:MAG: sigma-70 family RNA polymerase sigma factor, partial [bacterium]|nr:sigma-70 family RNA polymerase sigma factor [bacterium]